MGYPAATGYDDHDKYFRTRDKAAQRRLMARYDPLAVKLARQFSRMRGDQDDFVQVARLAILRALDRFDPGRGVKFTTFAWATASGELKRYCRDNEWSMHLPRALQERYMEVARAMDDLPGDLRREPTVTDVASALGEPIAHVRECLDIRQHKPLSLDRCLADAPDSVGPSGAREALVTVEDRYALAWALDRLHSPDREVVIMHYLREMTQDEIAAKIGGSQMRVSRALARGLDNLRALLAEPADRRPAA